MRLVGIARICDMPENELDLTNCERLAITVSAQTSNGYCPRAIRGKKITSLDLVSHSQTEYSVSFLTRGRWIRRPLAARISLR